MRIVVLTSLLPWPLSSGGQARQFHLLDGVRAEHEITLVVESHGAGTRAAYDQLAALWPGVRIMSSPVDGDTPAPAEPALAAWRALARDARERLDPNRSLVLRYPDPPTALALLQALDGGADVLHVELTQMFRYVPPAPRPPVVLVAEDVLSRRDARAGRVPGAARHVELTDRRARRHEAAAFRSADMVVVTGEPDAVAARAMGARAVRVVPNGAPDSLTEVPAGGAADRLVFVGWGGHSPNRDALDWWSSSIAPLLPPGTVLDVAGSGWEGASPSPAVRMLGFVDSLPGLLRDAVLVAPLRVGGGTKLKVVEAMAAGRPIIATPVAVEGLPVRDGVEALVRDTPEGIVAAIATLRGDPDMRLRLGSAAREASHPLLWSAVQRQMASVYRDVAAGVAG